MEESSSKKAFWQAPWLKHAGIVIGILCVMTIGIIVLRNNALKNGENLTASLKTELELSTAGSEELSAKEKRELILLIELFDFIKSRREHNRAVFMSMYAYHFTSTTLLIILSSLSTVLLLIVANQGIANTKPYFKTVFFTIAFITTSYAVIPQVYDFEKNIETNFDLYRSYEQLRYDIYSYATLMREGDEMDELQSFSEFYTGLIGEMRDLINIGIQFDSESLATPDFGESQPGF